MKNERGFSLVELLVATTITLVVLAGVIRSFNDSMSINEKTMEMSDLEQNLRSGVNMVVSDFVSAGWLIPIGGIPVPSGNNSIAVSRPSPPGKSLSFGTKIDAVNPGNKEGPSIGGQTTDIVTILYADNALRLDQSPVAAIGANGASITIAGGMPISGTGVNNPVQTGDLIALSNTNGNALQYVTGVNQQVIAFATGAGDVPNLNQPDAESGSVLQLKDPGSSPATFSAPTTAKRVWLITYYLDDTNSARPKLMRRVNYRNAEAVAIMLEDFDLTYDILDLASNPTDVASPGVPSQIRKANILLSGRSFKRDRNTGDYLRRSLTTQVSLRSLSFFKRY